MDYVPQIMNILRDTMDHLSSGYYASIKKMRVVRKKEYGIRIEHALVSTVGYQVKDVYPIGAYTCACCNEECLMDDVTIAYYHKQLKTIICPQCHKLLDRTNTRCFHKRVDEIEGSPIVKHEFIEYIDSGENHERASSVLSIASKFAHTHDLHFKDNKTVGDFRKYFLAKRVLRAFIRRVSQRRTLRLFQVLYYHANLGLDGAMVMAKRAIMPCVP